MNRQAAGGGTVVLGAGLAGLSAAHHLGRSCRVFEAAGRPGGLCATDHVQGYDFDLAGHLLHLRERSSREFVERLLPGRWQHIRRDARIHVLDREVRYPIQANAFGLPADVKARVLQTYLEARTRRGPAPENFAEWARQTFGSALAELFFEPYNRKLWTVPPRELMLTWMGAYVPAPEPARVIRGAFADIPEGGGYNARFWYPRKGGIGALPQALARHVPELRLNAPARKVDWRRRRVEIAGLGWVPWQRLVSTLPLPALAARCLSLPEAVRRAAGKLRANSVLVVNLGVRRARLHPAHWVYFPEKRFCFYRVGFPSNYGRLAPKGRSTLYAEVAVPAGTGWERRHQVARRVRQDLVQAGILRNTDTVEIEHMQYLRHAYVIYDEAHAHARKQVLDFFRKQGIWSIGRWGNWEYSAMEDALAAGKRAAEDIQGDLE
ncbi:MAG: FAD-dependent oxidoreductase [candidate division FCPU426 bacterium]